MSFGALGAVAWAQFRILRNQYPRRFWGSSAVALILSLVWYGMWTLLAVFFGRTCARPELAAELPLALPGGLMLLAGYWQLVPVIATSAGMSLDTRKLLAFPIPLRQLFLLEVLLRIPLAFEALLVLAGAAIGLFLNPGADFRLAPLALALFAAVNLFFSAGVKSLVDWVMEKRFLKEAFILILVIGVAAPQFLLSRAGEGQWDLLLRVSNYGYLPWTAAGWAATGRQTLLAWGVLLGWVAACYLFSERQFYRSLLREPLSSEASVFRSGILRQAMELFYRLPSFLLRDPLGALTEKELRAMLRAPRFRLVFFMGFSFGLLIWLPLAFQSAKDGATWMLENLLVIVSGYALILLGEVAFWNSFGFDRSAAQLYFVAPLDPRLATIAKNLAVLVLVICEITLVSMVCLAVGVPIHTGSLLEAFAVTLVFSLYLLAAGNLASVRYPRPVNPEHSWSSSSPAKMQMFTLFLYPLLMAPLSLAYLARFAFDSQWAFAGALAIIGGAGLVMYLVSLETVGHDLTQGREEFVSRLSAGAGPIQA